MFEIAKLLWDLVVLRDVKRKGKLTARVWLTGIGFVVIIYGVGLPCGLLYAKDPAYKPLFVCAVVFIACCAVVVTWLGIKWNREEKQAVQSGDQPTLNG